jgi:hypothetical protein
VQFSASTCLEAFLRRCRVMISFTVAARYGISDQQIAFEALPPAGVLSTACQLLIMLQQCVN